MNVREFSVRAAITRYPKAYLSEKLPSVSFPSIQKPLTPGGLGALKGVTAQTATDTEAFMGKWCFSELQIRDAGIEPLQTFQICESSLTKIQRESVLSEGNSYTESHVAAVGFWGVSFVFWVLFCFLRNLPMSRYLKLFKKHKHIEKTRWYPYTHAKNPLVCRTNVCQHATRQVVDVYVHMDPLHNCT